MLIDTHCHLNHEAFADDASEVARAAADGGVGAMVVVGYDLASSEAAVAFTESLPGVWAAVAVHPHDARLYDDATEARLERLAAHPRVVAIGEIGLDFHYDFSPRHAQREVLARQLALARRAGLPVIFHCREAYDELLDALDADGVPRGVMHCWAGTPIQAERALTLGLYLGVGGVLTFKKADDLRAAALAAPLDRLLLETDAPYLAPVPFRGKRNTPAYVRHVSEALAALRGVAAGAVADATTSAARSLFTRMG